MTPQPETREQKAKVDRLWDRYSKTKSDKVREQILFQYLPLVRQLAGKIVNKLPSSIAIDDLIDAGVIGLLEAIDRYDTDTEAKFETFAYTRIRGSIIDELRKMDWAPRSLRDKSKHIAQAKKNLEKKLGRLPIDLEVAEELDMSIEQYTHMQREVEAINNISLDKEISLRDGKTGNMYDFIEEQETPDPLETIENTELKADLVKKIERLPQTEKLVIALYYYEELTLKEIGEVLQLSESRVSQIHSKVIKRFRRSLQT